MNSSRQHPLRAINQGSDTQYIPYVGVVSPKIPAKNTSLAPKHPKNTSMLQGPGLKLGLGFLLEQLAQIKTNRVILRTNVLYTRFRRQASSADPAALDEEGFSNRLMPPFSRLSNNVRAATVKTSGSKAEDLAN